MRNIYKQMMKKIADDSADLWKLVKWVKNRSLIETVISVIRDKKNHLKHESRNKVRLLKHVFFPKPSAADLLDIDEYEYSESLKTPVITELEVRRVIKNVNLNKTAKLNETFSLTLH